MRNLQSELRDERIRGHTREKHRGGRVRGVKSNQDQERPDPLGRRARVGIKHLSKALHNRKNNAAPTRCVGRDKNGKQRIRGDDGIAQCERTVAEALDEQKRHSHSKLCRGDGAGEEKRCEDEPERSVAEALQHARERKNSQERETGHGDQHGNTHRHGARHQRDDGAQKNGQQVTLLRGETG